MAPGEFWAMSPYLFALKVEGYLRGVKREQIFFREMYALHCNIHRGEKVDPVDPKDILRLPGERGGRRNKQNIERANYSPEELAQIQERIKAA